MPRLFRIDRASLDAHYRQMQAVIHPDKFASRPSSEQRLAAARSADLNTAYQTLKNSALRAQYLCDLQADSSDVGDRASAAKLPAEFLIQQMQYREALSDAKAQRSASQLADLQAQVTPLKRTAEDDLARLIDDEHSFAFARQKINEFMFIDKLLNEIADAHFQMQQQAQLQTKLQTQPHPQP